MQGLYGPFTVTERVLQQIWLRQQFCAAGLKTMSGKVLEILDPGGWNHLAGPDFQAAKLCLDGQVVCGDVEVHFSAADWLAHSHAQNPAYNNVILHVLLYPDAGARTRVRTRNGTAPETLVLLPLLKRDLESIALDEALLEMEQPHTVPWVADFVHVPRAQRVQELYRHAAARWEQKCRFAAQRLQGSGWSEACHQLCLEVLGYARNRAPMARLALEFPLARWTEWHGRDADALYALQRGAWRLSGVRPANHPRIRLQQYLQLVAACPDWPARVAAALQELPQQPGCPRRLGSQCLRTVPAPGPASAGAVGALVSAAAEGRSSPTSWENLAGTV